MVMVDVRDKPGILTINTEVIDGKKAPVVVDSVIKMEEPSRPEEGETAHWYYSVPFPGVRYYGFDQRPALSKQFSPAKVGQRAGA